MPFFGFMFSVTFGLVLCMFIFVFAKIISEWNKNNHSPRLTVPAKVVAKRGHVSHNHNTHTHSTRYYVTFEFESGDRAELHVSASEFGMLVEGDLGNLTFQGTRYLGFERVW